MIGSGDDVGVAPTEPLEGYTMNETEVTTPLSAVIEGYFAMWNEDDPSRRRKIIENTWTSDAHYVEPLMVAEGHDGLDAGVAGMQARFPGHHLRRAGTVDTHHDCVRWSWELVGPDGGEALAGGTNVGLLAPEGRLRQVIGFFDHAPDA
jgi:hypothetical protein